MEECYFQSKSNSPRWVFFTFLKLYKWYQIAQSITYISSFIYSSIIDFQQVVKKKFNNGLETRLLSFKGRYDFNFVANIENCSTGLC